MRTGPVGESAAEQAWRSKFGFPTPPRKRYMIMRVPVPSSGVGAERGDCWGPWKALGSLRTPISRVEDRK